MPPTLTRLTPAALTHRPHTACLSHRLASPGSLSPSQPLPPHLVAPALPHTQALTWLLSSLVSPKEMPPHPFLSETVSPTSSRLGSPTPTSLSEPPRSHASIPSSSSQTPGLTYSLTTLPTPRTRAHPTLNLGSSPSASPCPLRPFVLTLPAASSSPAPSVWAVGGKAPGLRLCCQSTYHQGRKKLRDQGIRGAFPHAPSKPTTAHGHSSGQGPVLWGPEAGACPLPTSLLLDSWCLLSPGRVLCHPGLLPIITRARDSEAQAEPI